MIDPLKIHILLNVYFITRNIFILYPILMSIKSLVLFRGKSRLFIELFRGGQRTTTLERHWAIVSRATSSGLQKSTSNSQGTFVFLQGGPGRPSIADGLLRIIPRSKWHN